MQSMFHIAVVLCMMLCYSLSGTVSPHIACTTLYKILHSGSRVAVEMQLIQLSLLLTSTVP